MRLGVLVSGKGTNLQAILDAIARGELDATVAYVACNHRGAQAIERARKAGVPVGLYTQEEYGTRQAQQIAIAAKLIEADVQQVVLAGWNRVLTSEFVAAFEGRIINVHPSLLPAFAGGLHAIAEALKYKVKITGCTVHFVTNDLDAGPIIAQAAVPVLQDDTEETLAERIHAEEHRILVQSIKLITAGKLRIEGRNVICEP
ncbi:MAG: phosphoribosylglycinamide formyltransferase [Chloroflexota bacterium]